MRRPTAAVKVGAGGGARSARNRGQRAGVGKALTTPGPSASPCQAYRVTQADYSNLGLLMITVAALGLVPLLALPLLRRHESAAAVERASAAAPDEQGQAAG